MNQTPLFTDLDNTVFILETLNQSLKEFVNIDYVARLNLHIQMTLRAHRVFLDLCDRQSLVAVTTRSLEQYQRTALTKHVPYANVDNGATILINGIKDAYWTKFIEQKMANSGIDHNVVIDKFIDVIGYNNITKVDRFKYFGIVYLDDTANARVAANNITLIFLPPYSPELNPIEKLWGSVKRYLRSYYDNSLTLRKNLEKAILHYCA